jgi:hypothetical protein
VDKLVDGKPCPRRNTDIGAVGCEALSDIALRFFGLTYPRRNADAHAPKRRYDHAETPIFVVRKAVARA